MSRSKLQFTACTAVAITVEAGNCQETQAISSSAPVHRASADCALHIWSCHAKSVCHPLLSTCMCGVMRAGDAEQLKFKQQYSAAGFACRHWPAFWFNRRWAFSLDVEVAALPAHILLRCSC